MNKTLMTCVTELEDVLHEFYSRISADRHAVMDGFILSSMYPSDIMVCAALVGQNLGLTNYQTASIFILLQGAAVQKREGVIRQIFSGQTRRIVDRHRKMVEQAMPYIQEMPAERMEEFTQQLVARLQK